MGPTETTVGTAAHPTRAEHGGHHEEISFWRKYVFSTDHKTIGIQYAVTAYWMPIVL